jgi:heme-degrading monooxygenase HmoA
MIRIVKLTFKPEHVQDFLEHFETVKQDINGFPGCRGMKLLQHQDVSNIFFTFSEWNSNDDLNNYRKSELFGGIWPKVKLWFDQKAEAWSVDQKFDGFHSK